MTYVTIRKGSVQMKAPYTNIYKVSLKNNTKKHI